MLIMNQIGQISSVVKDHVQRLSVWPKKSLLNAPFVLLFSLPLPSEDGDTSFGDCGRSLILS